jgi:uncharacterized protein (TIGR00369 family)
MEPALLRQVMEEFIPFNKFLGVRVVRVERASVRLELPWRDEFIGDPMKRAIHGGVISTMVDVAGGMAAWSALEDPMARVSTVDLRVDYLRPGKTHAVLADGVVVRLGGRIAVTDMKIFHPGAEGEPIATGKGVYAVKVLKQSSKEGG